HRYRDCVLPFPTRRSSDLPIDRRVTFDKGEHWLKVVGVVGDVKQYGLDHEATDELYTPHAQNPGAGQLLVRTATPPLAMVQLLRDRKSTRLNSSHSQISYA